MVGRVVRPLLGRAWRVLMFGVAEVERGAEQRDVRERLRKVAHLPLETRVVFLGEQAEVIAQREEPLEEAQRIIATAEQYVVVGEPEAAGEKRAFAGRQAVVSVLAVVAQHEAIDEEMLFDEGDGARDARVVGWKKADERDDERRCVGDTRLI